MLRKEGPDSTVKKLHDNDIAEQARDDVIEYKTRKQRRLLRVV